MKHPTYRNPVIPGFHPDPSVCRVGSTVYLVTSSFEYFPGAPLFRSRDLVHWQPIGHCLTRESQLALEGAPASQGMWAATLRHYAGRFYCITTNVSGRGIFFVWTDNIEGPWSDPVWVDAPGIDPDLFFDEDGEVYLTWRSRGAKGQRARPGIWQAPIDLTSGALRSTPACILGERGRLGIEGPHIFRRHAYYYLLVAAGGTETGHSERVFRGPSPSGPWVESPEPFLRCQASHWGVPQCVGHADILQTADNRWWTLFLGTRPGGAARTAHLGRETFLAPVMWSADDWPLANGGELIMEPMTAEVPKAHPWPAEPARDDFDSATLGPSWVTLRTTVPGSVSLSERRGWLTLHGTATGLDSPAPALAWVGRRQQQVEIKVQARLEFTPTTPREEAGLVIWYDERHHYEVFVTQRGDRRCLVTRRRIGTLQKETAAYPLASGPVTLSIEGSEKTYGLGHVHNNILTTLDWGEPGYLSSQTAGGFTGVFIAMYATGNGAVCAHPAAFDWFEVTSPPAGPW